MTTESNVLPPVGDEIQRPEGWRPVPEIDGCTFSGYESSDQGRYRSIDRMSGNRNLKGKVLSTRRDEDGYVLVNIRCDSTDPDHNRVHTMLAHKVTLYTFAGPPEPGQEARHSPRGPAFNWWPEGFEEGGWGTRKQQHADKVEAGTATIPDPSFPCINAPACTNLNRSEGKRCRPCVVQLGVDTAALLTADPPVPLPEVAARFRCSQQWVYRLAVEHGGYSGTPADARGDTACPDCAARAARHARLLRVATLGLAGR